MSVDALLSTLEKLCALGRDLVASQQRELDVLEQRREAMFETFQESEQLIASLSRIADDLRAAPPPAAESEATLARIADLEKELALTVHERNEVFEELQRRAYALTELESRLQAVAGASPDAPAQRPAAPAPAPAAAPAAAPVVPIDFGPLDDFDDDDLDEIQLPFEARVKALPGLFEAREYTPDEVRIASIISYQPYAIREVAQLMGVSPEHARDQVQALIDKGWVDIIV